MLFHSVAILFLYLRILKRSGRAKKKPKTKQKKDSPSTDPSSVHCNLIINGHFEMVAVKKSLLRKGNREKRHSYDKLLKI